MYADLAEIGRDPATGGYNRFAWTEQDRLLKEWFAAEAQTRGLDLTVDRNGNSWAWWGNPDDDPGRGLAVGSHLDSVPSGGSFDGPLGVMSAFAAVDALRAQGFWPAVPIGVVCFGDEEGARFGVACAGSRLLTGRLDGGWAHRATDAEGVSWATAAQSAGLQVDQLGRDDETLGRLHTFVELHVEQGRGLVDLGRPVGLASQIWPHGRYRIDLSGRADHAGTTRLNDRADPMLDLARLILATREAAERNRGVATIGKVRIEPGAVNAIPGRVAAWVDARGADEERVRQIVADLSETLPPECLVEESWTAATEFDGALADELAALLGGSDGALPILPTGAGHDAGMLAADGVRTAMIFVRNPTGVSHSPEEYAEADDCHVGVAALARALAHLTGSSPARSSPS
jgi:N-carbamoyl-L-amino-acid hydrolase